MKENFLMRWSRLKRTLPAEAVKAETAVAPPALLPPVDGLDLSSDFLPFMEGEVAEELRRAALQKLFAAEHFNVMDGLDVYIDDYNKFEPIGEAMLQQLMQARSLLPDELPEAAGEVLPAADGGKEVAAPDPANGEPAESS